MSLKNWIISTGLKVMGRETSPKPTSLIMDAVLYLDNGDKAEAFAARLDFPTGSFAITPGEGFEYLKPTLYRMAAEMFKEMK